MPFLMTTNPAQSFACSVFAVLTDMTSAAATVSANGVSLAPRVARIDIPDVVVSLCDDALKNAATRQADGSRRTSTLLVLLSFSVLSVLRPG